MNAGGPTTRRRLLAAAAVGVAGCLDGGPLAGGGPPQASGAGMVPAGDGYLAAGTTTRGTPEEPPYRTWVAGLDGDGGVRWRRHHAADRWPGDDRLTGVAPLADGVLLFGQATREAVLADDALVHAVDARGRTRWRHTRRAATAVVDAVPAGDGAVVAGVDRRADPPSLWVARLDADGRTRWAHAAEGRVPAAVYRPGDGTTVVAGHATGGRVVPWLAVLDAAGAVLATRRFEREALRGLALSALVDGPGGPTGVATPAGRALTGEGAARALSMDSDWQVSRDRLLALADDFITAEDGDGDDDDAVRFVDAVPGGGGLVAVLGEGGWSTVATFDGEMARRNELLLQARTVGVHRATDRRLLLAGSRRDANENREVWLSRLSTERTDVFPMWTTSLMPSGA